jgi:large repetitive protein
VSGTTLGAGTQTLSVGFVPTDAANYNSVAATTVSLTVNKATPTITWATPSAITYGTALSATQLNASSGSLGGTFTYSPVSGTTLGAGTQL